MTNNQLYALYLDAWARNTTRGVLGVSSPHVNDTAQARCAVALGVRDAAVFTRELQGAASKMTSDDLHGILSMAEVTQQIAVFCRES